MAEVTVIFEFTTPKFLIVALLITEKNPSADAEDPEMFILLTVLPRPSKTPLYVRFMGGAAIEVEYVRGLARAYQAVAVTPAKSAVLRIKVYGDPAIVKLEEAPERTMFAP